MSNLDLVSLSPTIHGDQLATAYTLYSLKKVHLSLYETALESWPRIPLALAASLTHCMLGFRD